MILKSDDGFVFLLDEIRWQIFCHVDEEDKKLDARLREAPKIAASVSIPPGSCKQSVPLALVIFDHANNLYCNGTILPLIM